MKTALLYVHIGAGFVALTVGLVPMLSSKGGRLHKKTGLMFVWAMVVAAVTALVLAVPQYNFFLSSIGVFSLYMTLAGWRAARHHNRNFNIVDKILSTVGLATGVFMLGFGVYLYLWVSVIGLVLGIFGGVLVAMTIKDVVQAFGKAHRQSAPAHWQQSHIARMGGAYIATFTAFAVTNFTFLPPGVNWLVPTAVGSVLISVAIRQNRRKTQSNN